MKSYNERFYDLIAWFYPVIDLFLREQKSVMMREVNNLPRGSILEIGVGNGKHLSLYKRHSITGIDISGQMIKFARKRRIKNICLLKMNAEHLNFENESFDYVVISHVIAVVEKPEKVLEEAHRVLKQNGKLIILNHFTPDNWLRYIDCVFGRISKWFRLKSLFYQTDLDILRRYTIVKEEWLGVFSYYKLLLLNKN